MTKRPLIRLFAFALLSLIALSDLRAQEGAAISSEKGPDSPELNFPEALTDHPLLAELDPARPVLHLDATPNGSTWMAVDGFAHWASMVVNGYRIAKEYHEIPAATAQIITSDGSTRNGSTSDGSTSNGSHAIWAAEMHVATKQGFDSTIIDVYQDTNIIGTFIGDSPDLQISGSGRHWAMLIPYASAAQQGLRDVVLIDGKIVSNGDPWPHRFSFSHDETQWAFRSTNGIDEKLITSKGKFDLYKWNPNWDATIWRYTPDVRYRTEALQGRDYDFDFEHIARINRTAYSQKSQDTARSYMNYNGKSYGLYRWITEVQMDSSGKHVAFLACDPAVHARGDSDERRGIVFYDGKTYAGPFHGVSRLFMSPSGEHLSYSTDVATGEFYHDKKLIGKTGRVLTCLWSPDESHIAFASVGSHDKVYVVVGGKRSQLFEKIGRIGWTADGSAVEFVGLANGKLFRVHQPL